MKKLLLTVISLCSFYYADAQITTTETSTTQAAATSRDTTTKVVLPKNGKVKIVGGAQMNSAYDVVQNITKSKDHTTFVSAINSAGLSETLKSRGPLTVFAPTNEAFSKLTPGTIDTLMKPEHVVDLTRLLSYHVISGKLTSKTIAKQIAAGKGEATYTTLAGSKLRAHINGDRNIVLIDENGNESIISQFDIEQNNGIIDVVTAVMMPKTD